MKRENELFTTDFEIALRIAVKTTASDAEKSFCYFLFW